MTNFATALTIAAPDVCGPLAVFPILGPSAELEYRSFAEGAALGVLLCELPDGASVNRLVAFNPLREPVLLYEGEELRGAQQDRTLDRSVLVGAGASVEVPVTCVEHGRWDGSRHGEAFAPAPQVSHPRLRQMKNRAAGDLGVAESAQGEVWAEVARVSAHHGATGETGALRDVFEASSGALAAMQQGVTRRDGQLGAVCCIGGRPTVIDLVGRADVFAALHAPLVAGYALDAAEHETVAPPAPRRSEVQHFLELALGSFSTSRPGIGLGVEERFVNALSSGTRLTHDGELVVLTGYSDARSAPRIRRPSRRR